MRAGRNGTKIMCAVAWTDAPWQQVEVSNQQQKKMPMTW